MSVSAALTGLQPNSTYYFRIAATNAAGTNESVELNFTSLPLVPSISSEGVAEVERTTATLEASINPNGASVSNCEFEYGTTEDYGDIAPCSSLPGPEVTPVAVTASLAGLTSGQEYHYRVLATNAGGTSFGADRTFMSEPEPPTVSLGAAVSWSQPMRLPGGPSLVGVSCAPNTSQISGLCMAITRLTAFTAVVPSGGYAESQHPNEMLNVVCFSVGSCVAAGSGYVDIASISGESVGWLSNGHNGGAFNSLGCASESFCIHTQSGSEILWTTSPAENVSWNQANNPRFEIEGLSCAPGTGPGSGLCVAAGQSGYLEQSTAPSGNWSFPESPSGESGRTITGVSCPTTGFCAAVDDQGDLLTTTDPASGAAQWAVQQVDQNRRLEAISCVAGTTTCVSVDDRGYAVVSEESHAGSPLSIDEGRSLVSVSCPNLGFCEAVDSSGYLTYTTAGAEAPGLGGVTPGPGEGEATVYGSVNPNGRQVTDCTFEYGPTTAYGTSLPCETSPGAGHSPIEVQVRLDGLEPRLLYHYRLTATNEGGQSTSSDRTFKLHPGLLEAPSVSTGAATNTTDAATELHGTVNANGEHITACTFEYGPTESYGANAPCSPTPIGGETSEATVAVIDGLGANATYHYRLAATNATGTSHGEDQTLRTLPYPPVIEPAPPSAISQTSLRANATVNPNGRQLTDCTIEYGLTTAYGGAVPCDPDPGEGTNPVSVSGFIEGLHANTTYDYRVVATNPGGTSYEPNQTARTLPDPPTAETSSYISATATATGAVIPHGGEVTNCSFEYGNTHLYGHSVACSLPPGAGEGVVEVSAQLPRLVPGQNYHFRLVATNAGGTGYGSDQVFTAAAGAPMVQTGEATAITQAVATLQGTVNPNSSEVIECELEYGPTPAYGAATPCSTLPGSGASPVPVLALVGGLSSNSTYHFRVVARNASRVGYGGDRTFKTLPNPPVAFTGGGTEVTSNSAVLHGQVDPNGAEVDECAIVYGTTIAYGSIAPCELLPGSGTIPVPVSALLTALASSTEYHYRVMAKSAGGVGEGVDQTFETLPPGRAPAISRLSVRKGPAAGGTELTITGTGFAGATAVRFGGFNASTLHVTSPTSITVRSPSGTSGKTEIAVSTPGGTSGTSKAATWTYEAPTVTSLTPDRGARTGGTQVTVLGSGFSVGAGTTIAFGKALAMDVDCATTTMCAATVPASSKVGEVDVVASVGKAKSKKNRSSDGYRYE
ncbi:MAG TPA: IPT/TIG domain-containing protein [Solirubrobacteraceae bacterium]|nr:IPT/TIG domain-containing protein [Solirubrobacteraceae bacterium]